MRAEVFENFVSDHIAQRIEFLIEVKEPPIISRIFSDKSKFNLEKCSVNEKWKVFPIHYNDNNKNYYYT